MKMINEGYIINKTARIGKEKAEAIFKKYLRHIKRTIKTKIHIYDPLDFKTTLKSFFESLQAEEFKLIREFPVSPPVEIHLEELIRRFLVDKAYYHLLFEDPDLVENYTRDILIHYSIPLHLETEIADFVREKLETPKKFETVKTNFKERSKFKTYFYAMIVNLVRYYQEKYHVPDWKNPNDPEDMDRFSGNNTSPHTQSELDEIIARVEKLSDKEKLAFEFYIYDEVTSFRALGIALRISRFKAEKLLKSVLNKVIKWDVKDKKAVVINLMRKKGEKK